jgi:hypothetical protein
LPPRNDFTSRQRAGAFVEAGSHHRSFLVSEHRGVARRDGVVLVQDLRHARGGQQRVVVVKRRLLARIRLG